MILENKNIFSRSTKPKKRQKKMKEIQIDDSNTVENNATSAVELEQDQPSVEADTKTSQKSLIQVEALKGLLQHSKSEKIQTAAETELCKIAGIEFQ